MAWRVIEQVPLMMAWLAMMVAAVASTTRGTCNTAGHNRKNGLASEEDRVEGGSD
jgi:hypothetical protein